jgi:hypothetical protein
MMLRQLKLPQPQLKKQLLQERLVLLTVLKFQLKVLQPRQLQLPLCKRRTRTLGRLLPHSK